MAPLQSKDLKFGGNYMPAPMGVHGDNNQRKPTAPPQSEINLDINGGAGHSGTTAPVIVITDDNKRHKNNNKRQANNKQRSNAVCTGFSVVLVIFCCVITGLEIRNWMEVTKLQLETQQLRDKVSLFEKYYPVSPVDHRNSYDKIERFDNRNYEREVIRALNARRTASSATGATGEPTSTATGPNKSSNVGNGTDEAIYDGPDDNAYDDETDGVEYYDDDLEDLEEGDDNEPDKLLPYDETAYESTEKNKSSRRTRSVSSGDNGIPIIEESYAARRHPSKNKSVDDVLVQTLQNRTSENPKLNYDWSDKREPSSSNQQRPRSQFPKKYRTDDMASSASQTSHRNTIRQYYHHSHRHPERALSIQQQKQQQQRRLYQNANQQLTQPMEMRHRPLELQDITNGGQAKPRRRGMLKQPLLKTNESPRVRSMGYSTRFKTIGVHYEGDTSRYEGGYHEHYDGNGRLRHPGGVFTDWKQTEWGNEYAMDRFFKIDSGVVSITESGLYYIYAQIFYHDDHDTNSFVVERNSHPLFQCTTATHSEHRQTKSNTCYTGGIVHLSPDDTVFIRDLGSHRYTLFNSSKSYFGLIKLGDIRPPTELINS